MNIGSAVMDQAREDVEAVDTEPPVESKSLLLALPTELRLDIYSCLWNQPARDQLMILHLDRSETSWVLVSWPYNYLNARFPTALALLRICKQVSAEVQDYIYDKINFNIHVLWYACVDFGLQEERCIDFVRLARNVDIDVVCHAKYFRESARAKVQFDGLRALIETISLSQAFRKFRIKLKLSSCHMYGKYNQEYLEQRTIGSFLDVNDWINTGEDVRLVEDRRIPPTYVTTKGDEVGHGWALLSKLEALQARLADEIGDDTEA